MFKHRYLSAAVLALAVSAATPACAAGLYYQRPAPGQQRVADRAFDRGSRDGFDVGRDDARHHRRPEPERASRFRSADHDYDRHYGPRDQYQRVYRDGFREGYERGFREYRR